MQSEKCWVKFTHVIRHHLVVSMQGQPPSITDSQSEDERFSNLYTSNFWTMCLYLIEQIEKCGGQEESNYSYVLGKRTFSSHYLLLWLIITNIQ